MTLVEIVIGMVILVVIAISIGTALMSSGRFSVKINDRTFATQKCIQMMEELRVVVAGLGNASIGILDNYDDGNACNIILTTNKAVTDPGDPTSGNSKSRFCRNVSVLHLPNDPSSRQVYVRVYNATTMEPLAQTISVLQTLPNNFVPTQVFDIYILAIESVPGWWSSLSTLRPIMNNMISDMQTRNPGLEFREHWITRMSFGRDPFYAPYVNSATYADTTAAPFVYFYPGKLHNGTLDYYYYNPSAINGRINLDGVLTNNPPTNFSFGYSIADQFNNAMRYPDEIDEYNDLVAGYSGPAQQTPVEISLRMLLENLNSHPERVRNALIINLHGEMLPMPPIRNYSDPAKDPVNFPNIRVVTHPGNLSYNHGDSVTLRTYAYTNTPGAVLGGPVVNNISIYFPTDHFSWGDFTLRKATGSATIPYSWANAVPLTEYTLTNPTGNSTLVVLYNTAYVHTAYGTDNTPTGGLSSGSRLNGLEYIPCVTTATYTPEFPEGHQDLVDISSQAKNTARWVFHFNPNVLIDGQHKIQTSIGSIVPTGKPYTTSNLSNTYVWIATVPPATEQYQFLGDPRYMPYSDMKAQNHYNWYFDNVGLVTLNKGYLNYPKASAGWRTAAGEYLNYDLPRLHTVYRDGLLNSNAVYTNITGWSFYYMGFGGEIGYDTTLAAGTGSGEPSLKSNPWVPGGGGLQSVDEIVGSGVTQSAARLIAKSDNSWVGLPWLGELYPDIAYPSSANNWPANGNLPVGTGNYYRALFTAGFTNLSQSFSFQPVKRVNGGGAGTFYNGNLTGTGNQFFNHSSGGNTGTLTTSTGNAVSAGFNIPLPVTMPPAGGSVRVFALDNSDLTYGPPTTMAQYTDPDYVLNRTVTSLGGINYTANNTPAADYNMSAVVNVDSGTNRAYMVVNGFAPAANTGENDMAQDAIAMMMRGFLQGGSPVNTNGHINEPPVVAITTPTASSQINSASGIVINWTTAWTRWDSTSYTELYPANYVETTPLYFNLKYSTNEGATWQNIVNNQTQFAGVPDPTTYVTAPFTWNAPSTGNFMLRIEAYRDQGSLPLHYAYDNVAIYITP